MLQQIQFHVHDDEQTQQQIEHSMALEIRENYRQSVGVLERFIPSLAELVKSTNSNVSTLLCNKYSELNIVNYNSGQVLYGLHPKAEALAHFHEYMSKPLKLEVQPCDDSSSEALVCFGLGLGYHLEFLVNEAYYNHVIVYEPNVDYFICSLSSLNWKRLLQKAKEKGVALYLQMGADGTSFSKDMRELTDHIKIDKVNIYKHLQLTSFNKLEAFLRAHSWKDVKNWLPDRNNQALSESYLPLWAPLKNGSGFDDSFLNEDIKKRNLDALKAYFPDLHKEFSNYTPLYWCPTADVNGDINVCHKTTGSLYSASLKLDSEEGFNAFSSKPNKDGLLLSYTGKKLKGFLHYQLVSGCEQIIKGVDEVQSELPEKVKSLIMFGIGIGYSVEKLASNHDVEMLFVCEPNKDFFFASLYAVDWSEIINSFDKGKKRLYLNIGDDGTNLTNDLLVQFQTVGPYVLANTFFYQTLFNEKLTDAVASLREQLLVIISMGDYFDNAKYGIAHTHWALENEVPLLMSNSKKLLRQNDSDVPVFIVGNGPSLDGLLDLIKEEQSRVIIISCGTALQALHKTGITPDFHAEIETNRSSFDWLTRIKDPAYLKGITLLSCNGIHPDSASLFGSTLLALKQGEASTVSLTELDKNHPFALLDYAYPTVTNFAANLVTKIGFNQVYLFGTDMGFVSDTYHHSKSSGYYDESGNELYSYSEKHSMSLVIPGNFKPWVKTKYEFKVSKGVLEQTFAQSSAEVYNLNDGARISGAKALKRDFVLITSTTEEKKSVKNLLMNGVFSAEYNDKMIELFRRRYNKNSLIEELSALLSLLSKPILSSSDIEELVSEQREFIVSSYLRKKSLVFYYLNGTLNYINSVFSKLLNIADEVVIAERGSKLLALWRQFVEDAKAILVNDQSGFDNISSFRGLRREIILGGLWSARSLNITQQNSQYHIQSKLLELANKPESKDARHVVINWVDDANRNIVVGADVCNIAREFNHEYFKAPIKGLLVIQEGDYKDEKSPFQSNPQSLLNTALLALMSGLKDAIFLQRFSSHPSIDTAYLDNIEGLTSDFSCYSAPDYIVLTNEPILDSLRVLPTSDRLCYLPSVQPKDLTVETISWDEHVEKVNAVDSCIRAIKS